MSPEGLARGVTTATREEKAARAAMLRSEGLSWREVGDRLGISPTYAEQLVSDPDGSKNRARKMQRNCVDCGTAIRSDSPSKAAQLRCSRCYHADQKASAKWTRETIVAAIQRWADLYGKPPSASGWNSGTANPQQRERFKAGDYPVTTTVVNVFGGFGAGLRAAGFQPAYPDGPRNTVTPEEYAQLVVMRDNGASWPQIAARFHINTPAAIMRYRKARGYMSSALKAETVIEREIARYEDKRDRAEADAKQAGEQAERLRLALAALNNGNPAK